MSGNHSESNPATRCKLSCMKAGWNSSHSSPPRRCVASSKALIQQLSAKMTGYECLKLLQLRQDHCHSEQRAFGAAKSLHSGVEMLQPALRLRAEEHRAPLRVRASA